METLVYFIHRNPAALEAGVSCEPILSGYANCLGTPFNLANILIASLAATVLACRISDVPKIRSHRADMSAAKQVAPAMAR